MDWGPSLITRYDFDHTGLRLDTDYSPYFAHPRARPDRHLSQALRGNRASACVRRILAFLDMPCSARQLRLGNQDYHEHTSGASFQTGYFKKATIAASYYWGQGVNFVALYPASPTQSNAVQPALSGARGQCPGHPDAPPGEAAQDREHATCSSACAPTTAPHRSCSRRFPVPAAEFSTTTSSAANGTGSSRPNFPCESSCNTTRCWPERRRRHLPILTCRPQGVQRRLPHHLPGASRARRSMSATTAICRIWTSRPRRRVVSHHTPAATSTTAASFS